MTVILRLDRPVARERPPGSLSPRRRWIVWAALVSVALHALVFVAVLLWLHRPGHLVDAAETPATVELVMSPPGSDHDAPAITAAEAQPPLPPEPATASAEPVRQTPPAAPTPDVGVAEPPPPAPPPAAPALTLDLGSVASDTNALVTGDLVMPASLDTKFHNRKPSYPLDAARRGEQGAVVVLIHVAADGLVSGADVMQTSGSARLDQAAREAVLTWHFLPAVRDGQPVEAEMPMRFLFALNY